MLNVGSSSIKCALYSPHDDALILTARLERLGSPEARLHLQRWYAAPGGVGEEILEAPVHLKNVAHALPFLLDLFLTEGLLRSLKEIIAIGHRVVHGGEFFSAAARIDDETLSRIEELAALAPLHQHQNLAGIRRARKLLPGVPDVAVFDTAFHQTMEEHVYLYGISPELYQQYGIRKYGFHGTNHKYCSGAAAELLGGMPARMVTCHLGNGSSVTALKSGRSVDTSMGFTPTDGLMMGTRSGAIDPEAVLYLLRELHKSPARIGEFLNKESGLKAIAGTEDLREIWGRAEHSDPFALLAFRMLCYRITLFIGGYAAVLDGLDSLVFSGGIGENAWYVREAVCGQLGHLGVLLDDERNRENALIISSSLSKVKVLVIPANEELQIARETRDATLKKSG